MLLDEEMVDDEDVTGLVVDVVSAVLLSVLSSNVVVFCIALAPVGLAFRSEVEVCSDVESDEEDLSSVEASEVVLAAGIELGLSAAIVGGQHEKGQENAKGVSDLDPAQRLAPSSAVGREHELAVPSGQAA